MGVTARVAEAGPSCPVSYLPRPPWAASERGAQRTRGSTGPASPGPPQPCAAPRGMGAWAAGRAERRRERVRVRARARNREGWRRPPCQWGGTVRPPWRPANALAPWHGCTAHFSPHSSSLARRGSPSPPTPSPPSPFLPPSPSARAHAACATTTPYPRTPRELRPDPELCSSCHRSTTCHTTLPQGSARSGRGNSCPHQGGRSTRLIRWQREGGEAQTRSQHKPLTAHLVVDPRSLPIETHTMILAG